MISSHSISQSRKGFSILIALGTIWVLLILVTGLTLTYIREIQLSRTTYDEIIANMSAEWVFEYAMLKVRNHREGFSDTMNSENIDGKQFLPETERSKNLESEYRIQASATGYTQILSPNEHLIIPLFSGKENPIDAFWNSKNPSFSWWVLSVNSLTVTGLDGLTWTITSMSGGQSIGLTGMWNIASSSFGTMRRENEDCYDTNGNTIACNNPSVVERIPYFFDEQISIDDFLTTTENPYFIVTNTLPTQISIGLKSMTPFTLPTLTIETKAKKNWSVQTFRFTEDKSKYYDALKYGIYNTSP